MDRQHPLRRNFSSLQSRPYLRAIPLFGIGANAPVIIAGLFLSLHRRPLDIDYFVFAACAPVFPEGVNLVIFSVLVALDWLISLGGAYYLRVADILLGLRELTHLSPTVWIPVAAALIVALAVWLRISGRRIPNDSAGPWRTNVIWASVLAVVAGMQAVGAFGSVRIIQSSALRTLSSVKDFEPLTVHAGDYWQIQSATSDLPSEITKETFVRQNIGIVIVESWGLFKDERANAFVTAPFRMANITARYSVRFGSVPFKGSTVPGEMRELCGISAGYAAAVGATSNLTGCLPWRLRDLGYTTEAMHGFTRDMFGRRGWYPAIGFEHMFFAEDLPASSGFRYCGSQFPGVCDSDMAGLFDRELLRKPAHAHHRLVYWLTLGTHLQLDDSAQQHTSVSCEPQLGTQKWDVCGEANDIALLMKRIADIAADERLPATRFILVGDHAPPYLIRNKRELFIPDRVPYIELIPSRGTVGHAG